MIAFEEIQENIYEYGDKICAPKNLLKICRIPQDDLPCVQMSGDDYLYILSERGVEIERRRTKNIDVLYYWLMDRVVFLMASQYEVAHRVKDQDFRRVLFDKKIELMGVLSKKWEEIARISIQNILKNAPYSDWGPSS